MRDGVRRIFPLSLIAGPFGLVYGATAADHGIAAPTAIAASFIILAGAAQIALVDLIREGASWYLAVGTALVINLRFALYSASLAPAFREFPARWRFPLAHLLTDQNAVTSLSQYQHEPDPTYRRWFTLGAGIWFGIPWWIGTAVGVLLGGDIPAGWQIGFAVPLMFTALLVPTITSRPKLAAAIAGAAIAVSTTWLPEGVNIMLGALGGIAVGTILAERSERRPHR
ncbi:MAG: AzlC family ABC transporter permease [Acidimicrobiales bacterium]